MGDERDLQAMLNWAQEEPLRLSGDMKVIDALAAMEAAAVDHVVVGARGFFGLIGLRRLAADLHTLSGDWPLEAVAQRPPRWSPEGDLPELVQKLRDLSAVLIRNDAGEESILTTHAVLSALSEIAEPFLLISDIEGSVRAILDIRIPVHERLAIFGKYLTRSDDTAPQALDELSMGDYENLIKARQMWPRFADVFRSKDITSQNLATVRGIRNQLFHFRGALNPEEKGDLAQLRWWFEQARLRASRPQLSVVRDDHGAAAG